MPLDIRHPFPPPYIPLSPPSEGWSAKSHIPSLPWSADEMHLSDRVFWKEKVAQTVHWNLTLVTAGSVFHCSSSASLVWSSWNVIRGGSNGRSTFLTLNPRIPVTGVVPWIAEYSGGLWTSLLPDLSHYVSTQFPLLKHFLLKTTSFCFQHRTLNSPNVY